MAQPPDLAISPGLMSGENGLIPESSPAGDGMYLIAPDARTQAALPIHRARGERSLADLAHSPETSWPSASRLENPRHS